ncbi:hypothetical protein [Streptomyces sp. NRRL S-448]|uniref:hypothetical protein n=1 Tax=Streptomyces sp. NRRL S-448 TaxID=1463907 RepID=UPI000A486F9E
MFAIDHHVSPWIAWLLDPMVAVALGTVLIFDGRLSEYGLYPSGWASVLHWFAGLGTWVMNCWTSPAPVNTPTELVLGSRPRVSLVICGDQQVFHPAFPLTSTRVPRAELEHEHPAHGSSRGFCEDFRAGNGASDQVRAFSLLVLGTCQVLRTAGRFCEFGQ